jgi:hypothetical protein
LPVESLNLTYTVFTPSPLVNVQDLVVEYASGLDHVELFRDPSTLPEPANEEERRQQIADLEQRLLINKRVRDVSERMQGADGKQMWEVDHKLVCADDLFGPKWGMRPEQAEALRERLELLRRPPEASVPEAAEPEAFAADGELAGQLRAMQDRSGTLVARAGEQRSGHPDADRYERLRVQMDPVLGEIHAVASKLSATRDELRKNRDNPKALAGPRARLPDLGRRLSELESRFAALSAEFDQVETSLARTDGLDPSVARQERKDLLRELKLQTAVARDLAAKYG